jgi:hypothetical protein
MKGRAHQLFRSFQADAVGEGKAFGVCRVILLARIVPERLTPELDDPELERRIERAIETVRVAAVAR